jgi:hypothetical protein
MSTKMSVQMYQYQPINVCPTRQQARGLVDMDRVLVRRLDPEMRLAF